MRVDSSEGRVRMSFIDACFGDPEIDERIKLSVEVTMEADAEDCVSCSVDIDTGIQMPSPISSAPRPLLNSIASLVAKIILRSILPNFLESLRKDFHQWQRGKTLEQRWAVARDSSLMATAAPAAGMTPPPRAGAAPPPGTATASTRPGTASTASLAAPPPAAPQAEVSGLPAGDEDSSAEPLSVAE